MPCIIVTWQDSAVGLLQILEVIADWHSETGLVPEGFDELSLSSLLDIADRMPQCGVEDRWHF